MVQRRRLIAAALGCSILLAACGDDGPSDAALQRSADVTTTTSAPPDTTTTTTTEPPEVGPELAEARSPGELAARVTAAETLARSPEADPDRVADAAFELQMLYRQLGRMPEWDAAVLAEAPAPLHGAVTNNVAARREFRAMHSKLSDSLPAWRIIEPPSAEELLAHYEKGEATFGVPWNVLAAVNLVETGMGRIRGVSVAGAQGPMQFMPGTWEAYGEGDVNDPHDAIMGAARYLAANGGGRGDIDNALYRYNHSNRYVRGVKHYAAVMAEDPAAYRIFYHWQIVYLSTVGDIWLPAGYEQGERIAVTDYVAANPDHHIGTATN